MLGWRSAMVAFPGSTCLLQAQRDAGADLQPRAVFVTRRASSALPHLARAASPSLHPRFLKKYHHMLYKL